MSSTTIQLQDNHGRTWDVLVKCHSDGECFLTKGWAEFVDEISLECGGHQVFEAVSESTYIVRLYDLNCCEQDLVGARAAETRGSLKVASFYRFLVVNWPEILRIPPAFARVYEGLLKGETMTLASEEGSRKGQVYLEDGWPQFAKENQLEQDEFLTFKFKAADRVWRVWMFDGKGLRKRVGGFSPGNVGMVQLSESSTIVERCAATSLQLLAWEESR